MPWQGERAGADGRPTSHIGESVNSPPLMSPILLAGVQRYTDTMFSVGP